ncbi:Cytokine receptor, partial [Stegodyphus mimosarum]
MAKRFSRFGLSRRTCNLNHTVCLLLLSFFIHSCNACWGKSATKYGDMTEDYDLLVGSDLILNCTLFTKSPPEAPEGVNSSNLVFKKRNQELTDFTHQIDSQTAQLKIPNASQSDSGFYYCSLNIPSKELVCSSKVSVGYPPHNVTNFKCISRNFDNLTCSWDIEPSGVPTNYSLRKTWISKSVLQLCPSETSNNTFCQWRGDTDPPYQISTRNLTFFVQGNNSLGSSSQEFSIDHFEIVIPNSPENLSTSETGKQHISIYWLPPDMHDVMDSSDLQYQIWVEEINYESKKLVINAGNGTSNYTIDGLIPFISYNISLRCRSKYTNKDDMWSPLRSLVVRTNADVPYLTPDVAPEAFELHHFEHFRSVTLFWKPVPQRHFNGENFRYYIVCLENSTNLTTSVVNSSVPYAELKNLHKDLAYNIHIYSANSEGISSNFKTVMVDVQRNIVPGPKDIRAISHDLGHYNLSWTKPNTSSPITYMVFWCSSLKPWQTRCGGPIQWLNESLMEDNIILNLTDIMMNYQFAVVAKSENRSSGMHWASCIVPHKAALGKIPYVRVEQKTSTELQVIWNLDCKAQTAVVDHYEISYCRISKHEECKVVNAEPKAESFLLHNLHPFSNYSIKIRAFNKENVSSEDSEAKYQTTLAGAPSDPPRNVKVKSESNASFLVSWLPPSEPNGIITHYVVHYNNSRKQVNARKQMNDQTRYKLIVAELRYYSIYKVQVQACVSIHCSNLSSPSYVLTDVGEPGAMDPPRIEPVNSTHLRVKWSHPINPNGPIDFYDVQWMPVEVNDSSYHNTVERIHVKSLSTFVKPKCSKLGSGGIKYLFYIRAANQKNGINLYSPLSEPTETTACNISEGLAMIIGAAIGGTLALALFLLLIYKLVRWMSEKIHQVKSITVRLPKGLEGPEMNPLNNYESFKHGLVQNAQISKTERISYIIDENDNKNRHGSGSSQYSNSSTDELIFKNGKCTKFGRKPSGDSSGCSSMSSNTTPRMHLSSDSGTESDFIASPPDSVIPDQNMHHLPKPPLPILMEVHDHPVPEQLRDTLPQPELNKEASKNDAFNNGMVLKIDQPYSKFGISGNGPSTAQWRVNPLVFYSCNLANSEPSVFEAQNSERQTSSVLAPYSKIGLAKSSGDILSISSRNKAMGYSKFGLSQPCNFSAAGKQTPTLAMMVIDDRALKEFRHSQNTPSKRLKTDNLANIKESPHVSATQHSHETDDDCCYIKVGRGSIIPKKPSPGYVSFGEVKRMPEQNSFSSPPVNSAGSDLIQSTYPQNNAVALCDPEVVCNKSAHMPKHKDANVEVCDGNLSEEQLFNHAQLKKNSVDSHVITIPSTQSDIDNSKVSHEKVPVNDLIPETINIFNPSANNLSQMYCNDSTHFLSDSQNISSSCNNSDLPETSSSSDEESNKNCMPEMRSVVRPEEILLTPVVMRNGYVPFSTLSDSATERTVLSVPNAVESSTSLPVFPSGVCSESDQNYITPSNKSELKLLQEDSISKPNPNLPTIHCNGKNSINSPKKSLQSGVGFINGSFKYILKPLPKMESEMCEV